MSESSLQIGLGCKVQMHFTLSLEDGTIAETSREDNEALNFLIGDGTLTAGLEAAIFGLCAGDKQTLEIEAGIAFGDYDSSKIHEIPRDSFDEQQMELTPGIVIEFEAPSGEPVIGTLLEVGDEMVEIDFNHPMVNRKVLFEVEILSVNPHTIDQ